MLIFIVCAIASYAFLGLLLLIDPLILSESPADILKELERKKAKEEKHWQALLDRDKRNGK